MGESTRMEDYKYCPSCGAEYRPGFTRCPDCDVELVADLPAEENPDESEDDYYPVLDPLHPDYVYDPGDWQPEFQPVRLMTVNSEIEAEMVVGLLRSNNLRAYSENETSHGVSHYGGQAARMSALARYGIYVHPDEEDEARALVDQDLTSVKAGESEEEIAEIGDVGSEVLAAPRRPWTVILAVLLALAAVGTALAAVFDEFFG